MTEPKTMNRRALELALLVSLLAVFYWAQHQPQEQPAETPKPVATIIKRCVFNHGTYSSMIEYEAGRSKVVVERGPPGPEFCFEWTKESQQ